MTVDNRAPEKARGVRQVSLEAGRGRCRLWGTAVFTGDGVSVMLAGGERPHVGAVAIGIPRPSMARPGAGSATTSVLAVTGHKDDELARPLADELARRLGQIAVVVAGVHVDRPRASDFRRVAHNAMLVLEAVVDACSSARPPGKAGSGGGGMTQDGRRVRSRRQT